MIIAQVSDIHAAENNDNLARFERALSWIDFIAPDALVLTGDLIDDNWLDGYALIAAHLNKRSYPSFILPGNSDDRASMKSILNCHYWRNTCENDALHFVADIGELRLIGLDTTVGQLAGIPAYICGSICPENPLWFGTEIVPPVNDSPSFMIHRYTESQLVSHPVLL